MKYTYIANWKMNLSYAESIDYSIHNQHQLKALSQDGNIILCPSFVALAPIIEIFKNSTVSIGAQTCSEYQSGSYTGEVSAQSLAEMGVTHCFVGHSERRIYFRETTDKIIKKTNLLLENNIQPIICIGETQEQFEQNATLTILTEQLRPIIESIQHTDKPFMIAYEPIWSIGTGVVPESSYLEEVFEWLRKLTRSHRSHYSIQLLYGGSVTEKNISLLKKISHIDGFLIGNASTRIDEFARIIGATHT